MSRTKNAALVVFGLRIAYGAGLVFAPAKLGVPWIGPAANTGPTQVGLRGVGGREIFLHAGAAVQTLRGADVVPWLLVSLAGDVNDIVATFASRGSLPKGSAGKTALAAGGSGALTAAVLAGALRR